MSSQNQADSGIGGLLVVDRSQPDAIYQYLRIHFIISRERDQLCDLLYA